MELIIFSIYRDVLLLYLLRVTKNLVMLYVDSQVGYKKESRLFAITL